MIKRRSKHTSNRSVASEYIRRCPQDVHTGTLHCRCPHCNAAIECSLLSACLVCLDTRIAVMPLDCQDLVLSVGTWCMPSS